MRGSVLEDDKTWVCAEHWTAPRHNGYVEEPDIDTSNGVLSRIKFYISENQIKVAWTSYELVDDGNWEYLKRSL